MCWLESWEPGRVHSVEAVVPLAIRWSSMFDPIFLHSVYMDAFYKSFGAALSLLPSVFSGLWSRCQVMKIGLQRKGLCTNKAVPLLRYLFFHKATNARRHSDDTKFLPSLN
jgi:hypothetical protein